MNPANVPPWGCPWHGQVKSGRVYLPNGTNRVYRQPEATSYIGPGGVTVRPQDTYGITHRHAAGLPSIVRDAEEQVADAAAGRQWRNEAILSGGRPQVHAKLLSGWIYIDPAGARWLVRIAELQNEPAVSFTSPFAVTVELIRFGVLGGAPESYSYNVSLPFGDTDGISSGSLLVDAISPTGNAAVVMAFRRFSAGRAPRLPVNFTELTITGLGAEALIAASVVRDITQISQVTPVLPSQMWWLGGDLQWYDAEPESWFIRARECVQSGNRTFSRIIALWYRADGLLQDVVFRTSANYSVNAARPEAPSGPGMSGWPAYSAAASMTGEVQIVLGATVISSAPLLAAIDLGWDGSTATYTHSVTVDGVVLSGDSTVTRTSWTQVPFPDIAYLTGLSATFGTEAGASLSIRPEDTPDLNPSSALGSATLYRGTLGNYWYSRQVVGFEISTELGAGTNPASRAWRNLPPASPSGLAAGTTQLHTIATPSTYYGSHDPYTGDVAWYEPSPVCYV